MDEKIKPQREKVPTMVQFTDAVNIGGNVVTGTDVKRHKVKLEKTATGLWIKRDGWNDRWVPDDRIRFIEFE